MTDFFDKAAAKAEAATDYEDHITWKPTEAGDVLQGTLVDAKVGSTQRGDHPFILTIDEYGTDNTYTVWVGSSPFHLEEEVTRQAPMVGKLIYLTLTDIKQPKDPNKNAYKLFKVEPEEQDFDFWHKLLEQQRYEDNKGGSQAGAQDGGGDGAPVVQSHIGPDEAPF